MSLLFFQEAARDKVLGTKRDFEIHRTEALTCCDTAAQVETAQGELSTPWLSKGTLEERGTRPGSEGLHTPRRVCDFDHF